MFPVLFLVAYIWLSCIARAVSSTSVGYYVASGIGISRIVSSPSAPAKVPVTTGQMEYALITENGTVYTATRLPDGEMLVANTTVWTNGQPSDSRKVTANSTHYIAPTVTGTASQGSLRHNSSVDECYSSWLRYWSNSYILAVSPSLSFSTSYQRTETDTITYIVTANPKSTIIYVTTIDTTETVMDGGFPITTQTIDTTSSNVYTESARSASTSVETYTGTYFSVFTFTEGRLVPSPTCKLPKIVPQCQSDWQSWISTQLIPSPTPPPHCDIGGGFLNNRTVPPCATTYNSAVSSYEATITASPPLCTEASIGGKLCSSIRENYVTGENYRFFPSVALDAPFFSGGYIGNFVDEAHDNFNTTFTWPTAATLGVPSCTMGCGRCAVTGGTVRLIYWPATATANATIDITGPVLATTLGTTLTSPTLYISYKNVYAADGCGIVGPTITNTIVAIPTNSPLSSVYGGTIPCDAHFRYTQEWTATASFNVTDLNSPVPYSIYSSQPWCATYLRDQQCQGSCPTTRPYEPILVVPEDVLQGLSPDWATCYGDLRGQYDPPIALQPDNSVAGASVTFDDTASPATSATPASHPQPATVSATTTPTALPDIVSISSQALQKPSTHTQSSAQYSQGSSSQNIGGVLASILGSAPSLTAPRQASGTLPASGSATVLGDPSNAVPGGSILSSSGLNDPSQTMLDPSLHGVTTIDSQVFTFLPVSGDNTVPGGPDLPSSGLNDPSQVIVDPTLHGVATFASHVFTFAQISEDSNSRVVAIANGGSTATLTAGGPAATVAGQVVSAPLSGGVVFGTGSAAETFVPAMVEASESVFTIGSEVYTASTIANRVVLANSATTITVPAGGLGTSIGTVAYGVVLANSATTITIPAGGLGPSTIDQSLSLVSSGDNGTGLPSSSSGSSTTANSVVPNPSRTTGSITANTETRASLAGQDRLSVAAPYLAVAACLNLWII